MHVLAQLVPPFCVLFWEVLKEKFLQHQGHWVAIWLDHDYRATHRALVLVVQRAREAASAERVPTGGGDGLEEQLHAQDAFEIVPALSGHVASLGRVVGCGGVWEERLHLAHSGLQLRARGLERKALVKRLSSLLVSLQQLQGARALQPRLRDDTSLLPPSIHGCRRLRVLERHRGKLRGVEPEQGVPLRLRRRDACEPACESVVRRCAHQQHLLFVGSISGSCRLSQRQGARLHRVLKLASIDCCLCYLESFGSQSL
mmetsp:Transcript_22791/g.43576  ORF Transcript_22791/g.43576 Transcript_22791/m.43576 type:complete len:258 (-) Transcript_22791:195-968(-)